MHVVHDPAAALCADEIHGSHECAGGDSLDFDAEGLGVVVTGLPERSLDFGYVLGVLHHIPDTEGALASVVRTLKPGAPLLVYLYYAFDNRPLWFRSIWPIADVGRRIICRLPMRLRYVVCDAIALTVYWPFARAARALDRRGTPLPRGARARSGFRRRARGAGAGAVGQVAPRMWEHHLPIYIGGEK